MLTKHNQGFTARPSRRDRLEYRMVWSLCFVMALVTAIFRRLAGQHSTRSGVLAARRETIVMEAKSAAHAAAGYAYSS